MEFCGESEKIYGIESREGMESNTFSFCFVLFWDSSYNNMIPAVVVDTWLQIIWTESYFEKGNYFSTCVSDRETYSLDK